MADVLHEPGLRLLDACFDAVLAVDARDRVVHVNPAAERLLGCSRADVVAEPVRDLIEGPLLAHRHTRGLARTRGGLRPVDLRVEPSLDDSELRIVFAHPAAASAADIAGIGTWERDLEVSEGWWSDELYRMHGLDPGSRRPAVEMLMELVHDEDRERIRRLLDRALNEPSSIPRQGVTTEYRAVRPDGTVRNICLRGRIERDDHDRPIGWVGSAQDVTDERMTERELKAHYAVGQALRDWETFEEGAVDLLRRLATALAYPMCSLWLWDDREGALACRAFWSEPDVDPEPFEQAKRGQLFRPGEGKPGRAWTEEEPMLTADLPNDPEFRPREAAVATGLRSSVAFPAVGYDGPVAVLALYGFQPGAPSESLLRTLTGIGQQLGRFLERRRGQFAPQRLTDRELEVLRLASAGHTGPAIAEQLVVSPSTVKTHFENIYDKLGVSDRAAAVALALRTGLFR